MDARTLTSSESSAMRAGSLDRIAFVLWNQRLLDAFFSPASRGDEIWLQVSPAELDALAPDLGGDEGFCAAVRGGPPWVRQVADSGPLFVFRAQLLAEQRANTRPRPADYIDPGFASSVYAGRSAPTYLPYLAALVRSTAVAQKGFYTHLREAMGLPERWYSNEMADLQCVWDDLARWTERCAAEFGAFNVRVLGGHAHIGVPRSQSIISPRDSELCGRLFAQAGLRPGQELDPFHLGEIRAQARNLAFLSRGFREALTDPDYRDPLNARLRALFEEWDGTIPRTGDADVSNDAFDGMADKAEGVELCLRPSSNNELPWQVHWRVPAVRDVGVLELSRGAFQWTARLSGTRGATTNAESPESGASSECLCTSAHSDVEFAAHYVGDDSERISLGTLVFSQRKLRILGWSYDALDALHELREQPLPLYGCVYLLAPPDNAKRLLDYLQREALDYALIASDGLPPGWLLASIIECGSLTEDQRATLPDGDSERPAPRMIKFVGGRSVRRAGVRQYLPYDLPTVELDAPFGTRLQGEGVVLSEVWPTTVPEGPIAPGTGQQSTRCFRLRISSESLRSFTLQAIHGREQLAEARLRVTSEGGLAVETGEDFALDAMARPVAGGHGLRGLLRGVVPVALPTSVPFAVPQSELGRAADAAQAANTKASVAALFLDSLALAGSLSFGAARDQLSRLISSCGETGVPAFVLLHLRSRGHLELEVDHKGRTIRVHKVQPGLYPVSLTTEGRQVYGVLGSLRLHHWQRLAALGGPVQAFCREGDGDSLDVWRLVADDASCAEEIARLNHFDWHAAPSLTIARWAPNLAEVQELVTEWAVESLGAAGDKCRRLSAATSRFVPSPGGFALQQEIACELFRVEDTETRRHDVYALGFSRPGAAPRYAFVRDSRWGIWLALTAFGRFVSDCHDLSDASPWPLSYNNKDGTLWVPARAGLPAVLERALVLSSGCAPELVLATGDKDANGLRLRHQNARLGFPLVSRVYTEMTNGKWLAYRWVTRDVAEAVAAKLGAALMDA